MSVKVPMSKLGVKTNSSRRCFLNLNLLTPVYNTYEIQNRIVNGTYYRRRVKYHLLSSKNKKTYFQST